MLGAKALNRLDSVGRLVAEHPAPAPAADDIDYLVGEAIGKHREGLAHHHTHQLPVPGR
jgi:hypothetical protein